MISATHWLSEALERGITFYAGVPCSFLTPFINATISDIRTQYVGATSEGEAVALACGAWLAGRQSAAICQNSGFGNTINPLTSLSWTFRIPHLVVTTWRGDPTVQDEPQHELMGRNMEALLAAVDLPFEIFPSESDSIAGSLDRAFAHMNRTRRPFGFLMRKGTVAPTELVPRVSHRGVFPAHNLRGGTRFTPPELSRFESLRLIVDALGERPVYLGTTGKLGRELFTLGDGPNRFYNVGSMGCVSAIGLGIALCRPQQRVVVLDGDGSVLMKMGNLATIGHHAPRNFLHFVLDNECHESTGGQATVSSTVDFASVALAAGYRFGFRTTSAQELQDALSDAANLEGPVLIHHKILVRTESGLGRPTIHPSEVAARLRAWLLAGDAP